MSKVNKGQIEGTPDKNLKKVVGKYECRFVAKAHLPVIETNVGKMQQKGLKAKDAGIIIINVNYPVGKKLANKLVPDFDWQKIRNQGETPYACGIVMREGFTQDLSMFDIEAGNKLKTTEDIPIIVFDKNTVEVFALNEIGGFDGRSGAS